MPDGRLPASAATAPMVRARSGTIVLDVRSSAVGVTTLAGMFASASA